MTRILFLLVLPACDADWRPVQPINDTPDPNTTTPTTEVDDDGDGFAEVDGDCDDVDPLVHPDAVEVCDDVDNNCDGTRDEGVQFKFYADRDGDGYGGLQDGLDREDFAYTCTPEAPEGFGVDQSDCDDANEYTHPDALEWCDGIDNNCVDGVDEGVEGGDDQDDDGTIDCLDPDYCAVGGRVNDGTMWAWDRIYGPEESFGPWWVPVGEGHFVARMDETTSYEAYYNAYYEPWDPGLCGDNGWELCTFLVCDATAGL